VYEVKVSASTKVGEGENTTAQEFTTDEDSKLNCTCYLLLKLSSVNVKNK
jgi:ferredoxin